MGERVIHSYDFEGISLKIQEFRLRPKRLIAGDLVELRSPREILATLDDEGCLDGLPFMPEMLAYFGKAFPVGARVERACDTISGPGVRRIPDAVVLDDARCDGSFHGGCQARCRIYWKEEWLRLSQGNDSAQNLRWTEEFDELAARVSRVTRSAEGGKVIFRCQATALPTASLKVRRREAPRSYAMELVSKNVEPRHFLRVLLRTIAEGMAMSLRLMPRGEFMPYDESKRVRDPSEPREFAPGELVRIRSKDEIARTLGRDGKNKGLWFDREMAPYCGKTVRILRKVERIIDEPTGKMIELKNDCYMLEGIICKGDLSFARRFCPRAIYPYWRACWLEPVEDPAMTMSTEPGGTGHDQRVSTPLGG